MSVEFTPTGEGENRLPAADLLAKMPENPSNEQVVQLVTTMVDTSFEQLNETSLEVIEDLGQKQDQADKEYRRLTSLRYPQNTSEQVNPERLIPLLIQRDTARRDLLSMDIAD